MPQFNKIGESKDKIVVDITGPKVKTEKDKLNYVAIGFSPEEGMKKLFMVECVFDPTDTKKPKLRLGYSQPKSDADKNYQQIKDTATTAKVATLKRMGVENGKPYCRFELTIDTAAAVKNATDIAKFKDNFHNLNQGLHVYIASGVTANADVSSALTKHETTNRGKSDKVNVKEAVLGKDGGDGGGASAATVSALLIAGTALLASLRLF
jgi:hypothetical protein